MLHYDPTLVEIHQSMWNLKPKVDIVFHNRQQLGTKQSMFFLLRQLAQTDMSPIIKLFGVYIFMFY